MKSVDTAKQALSVQEFCLAFGIGKDKLYREVKAGRLKARKSGKRTLILKSDAEAWAASLPTLGLLDGWPRKQIKLALLIAINARTHIDAVRALADRLRLDSVANPYPTAQGLIRAAKAAHPHIAHAIGSDAGVRLMRRNSEIAAQVMCQVLRATGILPLSVHDSFIVPIVHEGRLQEAMENALPCHTAGVKIPCH